MNPEINPAIIGSKGFLIGPEGLLIDSTRHQVKIKHATLMNAGIF